MEVVDITSLNYNAHCVQCELPCLFTKTNQFGDYNRQQQNLYVLQQQPLSLGPLLKAGGYSPLMPGYHALSILCKGLSMHTLVLQTKSRS